MLNILICSVNCHKIKILYYKIKETDEVSVSNDKYIHMKKIKLLSLQ